jgi:flagellar P-ring protein precursor FlgI
MKRIALIALLLGSGNAEAARLKDLIEVQGFRSNHLIGIGLVVGLNGTGDRPGSFATQQPLATIMRNLGSSVDPSQVRAQNVALVTVTADLPPFARPGVPFDVTVSSMGTAKSLAGGMLIATALKGVDRNTYAIAQGALTVGGYQASSSLSGSFKSKNHVAVGRIPGGGIVEREVPQVLPRDRLSLLLKEPDFTTANRIAEAIDKSLGEQVAVVRDPGMVEVTVSEKWTDKVVGLIAAVEAIEAEPDAPARVIIDERTGTVVVGEKVTLSPAAISYGGITVEVTESFGVSQPNAFAEGETVVIPSSDIQVAEHSDELRALPSAPTLGEVVAALNALKVNPRDLVTILQALRAAGALRAEIETL